MEKKNLPKWYPSEEQIQKWKNEFGDVHLLKSEDGQSCILKKPTRSIIKMAMAKTAQYNEQVTGVEVLIKNCWLVGDESLKTDTGAHIGFIPITDKLMSVKKAEIKKL